MAPYFIDPITQSLESVSSVQLSSVDSGGGDAAGLRSEAGVTSASSEVLNKGCVYTNTSNTHTDQSPESQFPSLSGSVEKLSEHRAQSFFFWNEGSGDSLPARPAPQLELR